MDKQAHYKAAWQAFKAYPQYKKCVEAMQHMGMKQPYIDNILKEPFEFAYNSHNFKLDEAEKKTAL